MNGIWDAQLITGTNHFHDELVRAARLDIHQRSTHHIRVDPFPQQTFNYEINNPIPPRAIETLNLMINGVYSNALPEWFTTVQALGYQTPIKVFELLIRFFRSSRSITLTPIVREFLGIEGIGLARTLLTDATLTTAQADLLSLEKPIRPDNREEREAEMQSVTDMLHKTTRGDSYYFYSALRRIHRPWSLDLTQAFFEYLLTTKNADHALRTVNRYVYFFALPIEADTLKFMLHRLESQNQHSKFKVSSVLAFRRHMLAAIGGA